MHITHHKHLKIISSLTGDSYKETVRLSRTYLREKGKMINNCEIHLQNLSRLTCLY